MRAGEWRVGASGENGGGRREVHERSQMFVTQVTCAARRLTTMLFMPPAMSRRNSYVHLRRTPVLVLQERMRREYARC